MTNEEKFTVTYLEKLAQAIAEHPKQYGGQTPKQAPDIVARMVPALKTGNAHVGIAAKAAARALGIKTTAKAILEYINS